MVKNKNHNSLFLYQPEGISMSVPMKNGGMSKTKAVILTLLSGLTTGIGAFFGAIVGGISENIIGICLAFAARSNALHSIR